MVGSGPSAASVPLEKAAGNARFIAINNSWRLCPWADVLYAVDKRWWDAYKEDWQEFKGLKVTGDHNAAKEHPVKLIAVNRSSDRMDLSDNNLVGWAGNSGFQAVNMAVKWGCAKVLMVGFDMSIANGYHWHGKHIKDLNNPSKSTISRWVRCFDGAAQRLREAGVQVVNCSPTSALKNYQKVSFEEAFS